MLGVLRVSFLFSIHVPPHTRLSIPLPVAALYTEIRWRIIVIKFSLTIWANLFSAPIASSVFMPFTVPAATTPQHDFIAHGALLPVCDFTEKLHTAAWSEIQSL